MQTEHTPTFSNGAASLLAASLRLEETALSPTELKPATKQHTKPFCGVHSIHVGI